MSKAKKNVPVENPEELFGRVVSILEQARGNVVRAVNTQMVLKESSANGAAYDSPGQRPISANLRIAIRVNPGFILTQDG